MINFLLGYLCGLLTFIAFLAAMLYVQRPKPRKGAPIKRTVAEPPRVHNPGPKLRSKANTDSAIWDREHGR